MTVGERATRAVWVKDFTAAAESIRDEWLTIVEDGSLWITSARRNEPAVVLYHKLAMVGFARGWLR
jgi:hypothetical protein